MIALRSPSAPGVAALLMVLLAAALSPAQEVPDDKIPALYIRQDSNGLPGQPEETPGVQELVVAEDRLFLQDQRSRSQYIFRLDLDPPRIWELWPDNGFYQDAQAMQDIQNDRDLAESQRIRILRREYSGAELDRALAREHLRADGSREVTVEKITDEAGAKRLGHPVEHYRVRENGRTIVDLHVTEALDLKIPFFEFYRRVGAFSEEVLEKLRGIPGVPLEASITVVTATLNVELDARVVGLEEVRVPRDRFELPEGAQEYKESTIAYCPHCGLEVEKSDPGARGTEQGQALYFCSKDGKKAWVEARRRAGGDRGTGKDTGSPPGKDTGKPPPKDTGAPPPRDTRAPPKREKR